MSSMSRYRSSHSCTVAMTTSTCFWGSARGLRSPDVLRLTETGRRKYSAAIAQGFCQAQEEIGTRRGLPLLILGNNHLRHAHFISQRLLAQAGRMASLPDTRAAMFVNVVGAFLWVQKRHPS